MAYLVVQRSSQRAAARAGTHESGFIVGAALDGPGSKQRIKAAQPSVLFRPARLSSFVGSPA